LDETGHALQQALTVGTAIVRKVMPHTVGELIAGSCMETFW